MILTCDKCHTRYLLPTHLLGAEGRRVRCTICREEWFQIPEDDDFGDSQEDFTATHDYVNEISDNDDLPLLAQDVIPPEPKKFFKWRSGMSTGLMAAVFIAVALFTGLLMFRESVTGLWPDSAALYDVLGLKDPIPGEGLVFENLKATTSYNSKGVEILSVTGDVMNIRNYPVQVPGLRFALRRKDGSEVESWSYPSPKADIPAQQSIPLTANYPEIAADVVELNVKFIAE